MKQDMHENETMKANPEAGFALYMAIGFIVLISVLAGSVGTKLNIAALSDARKNDRRAALDEAEAGLGNAWHVLSEGFALDATWSGSAIAATDSDIASDRDKCIAPYESDPATYYPSARATNGDRARRYFIKRDGNSYRLYGCGYDEKGTRIAFGLYDVSGGNLVLNRLRRY